MFISANAVTDAYEALRDPNLLAGFARSQAAHKRRSLAQRRRQKERAASRKSGRSIGALFFGGSATAGIPTPGPLKHRSGFTALGKLKMLALFFIIDSSDHRSDFGIQGFAAWQLSGPSTYQA